METVKAKLKAFILQNFLYTSDTGVVDDDASFMESGIVDSTGVLEIVNFLEEEFGIKIEDDELVPTNFDTVNSLDKYVSSKLQLAGIQNR